MAFDFVFLMDPIESIRIDADSTFALMLEARARGHTLWYAHPRELDVRDGRVTVAAQRVEVQRTRGGHFTMREARKLRLDDADAVFMRLDPPFDANYLVYTHMLDRIDRSRVVCVNDPAGIRAFNEKLSATAWPELMPTTLVSTNRSRIRAFVDEVGVAVAKPLMNAGGFGVVRLSPRDPNTSALVDLLTDEGRRPVQVQRHLEAIEDGDKRIILLNGSPIGALNRRPMRGELRANMHVGGTPEPATVTPRDREICEALAPELVRHGLIFVGIDVIGGHLTEINVTSPTGLQEIDRFDGVSLEGQILDWVENTRRAFRDGSA